MQNFDTKAGSAEAAIEAMTFGKTLVPFTEAGEQLQNALKAEGKMSVVIVDDDENPIATAEITGGINTEPSLIGEDEVIGVTITQALPGATVRRAPNSVFDDESEALGGVDRSTFSIKSRQRPAVMVKYIRVPTT